MSISDENRVYEMAKDIVLREVGRLHGQVKLVDNDVKTLFELIRIYDVLKSDLRDDIKAGLVKV